MTPTGIERQEQTTANPDFGGLMIGIIAVAPALAIAPPATVRVPAMIRVGTYLPTGFTPTRDVDAPAGEPNGSPFMAAMPGRLGLPGGRR